MKFQTILLTFFGIMAVVGLLVFATSDPKKGDTSVPGAQGNVQIWGTFQDTAGLSETIKKFNDIYKKSFSISYQFHDPKNFDSDIVEALASGTGPDVLLLPDDLILRHFDKIELVPYTAVPPGLFSSSFIQASEIYMRDDGLVALPFAIDPMVMYWNRDIFTNASVTEVPKFWDEFLTLTPKFTKRDARTSELVQSAISFGEYANVTHAKDILAMLFLQVGNPIVKMNGKTPKSTVAKSDANGFVADQDVVSALRFFMDFSNPLKNIFTWSRARSDSRNEFINGNLAVYFDYASAYSEIKAKNPHLNFAVAQVPEPRGTKAEVTFAKVHGLAVLKSSKNKSTAFVAMQKLLFDANPAKDFAAAYGIPPVRRDLLAVPPTDAAMAVFFEAAIRARTWLDPKPEISDKAFQTMVESVSSGRNDTATAVAKLNTELDAALSRY